MEIKIESSSIGKVESRNEDGISYSNNSFVLVDGATDKYGIKYSLAKDKLGYNYIGNSGGELAKELVLKRALVCNLNGVELIEELNKGIFELYENLEITSKVIQDPKYRFSANFICARIVDDELIITSLGDCGFRINGEYFCDNKKIDEINAQKRSDFINLGLSKGRELNEDLLKDARDHIHDDLIGQFKYHNNEDSNLSYGCLDGTKTPEKFIHVKKYKLVKDLVLELFSDGYFKIPKFREDISIDDWEKAYDEVEKVDPYKFIKYKSTKQKDDRTIVIIRFI